MWEKACETGNFVVVENFMDLMKLGLKIGFEKYKKLNKEELTKRQIAQNNWEAFFIADFLKLFDEFILPKGAGRNMWLKWVQSQETQNSHQKQADLSEQINEQKIANQTAAEQNKVENFRESLVKSEQKIINSESKSQELTFRDIPKSWEEFGLKYDEFLKRYEIWEKLAKAEIKTEKFEPREGILPRYSADFYTSKIKNIELSGLKFSTNNDLFKGKNLHVRNPQNLVGISICPEPRNFKLGEENIVLSPYIFGLKSPSIEDNIKNPTTAYLELREFFAKFGLEF